MDALDKAKISYVRVSTMLPDFQHDEFKYRLSRDDLHPDALDYRPPAGYEEILPRLKVVISPPSISITENCP